MKLLIISDEESKFIWDYFDRTAFEGISLTISAGDLKSQYLEFIATMIPAPVLYVPGNHDIDLKDNPPGGVSLLME